MNKSHQNIAETVQRNLARRYRAEFFFKLLGIASLSVGFMFLVLLLGGIFLKGYPAFFATYLQLEISYDADVLEIDDINDPHQLNSANYNRLLANTLYKAFPDVSGRRAKRNLKRLLSNGVPYYLQARLIADPGLLNTKEVIWLLADAQVDMYFKDIGHYRALPEDERLLDTTRAAGIDVLIEAQAIETRFNWRFLSNGDSRDPEMAGIGGALMGSLLTLFLTLLMSFPIGVATAIYLEEFAAKNKWTDLIEININNLASVPSIIFGLLGLAVFMNFMSLPRSAPLVGSLVLTLMTLPTVIIASRASIQAVPPSIREAALGIGASKMQTVLHHVLPLAMPGMLTGSIIGMARALGETAPLLMIGMVAFIVDVPGRFTDMATVLPVQIYLWADIPERAFVAKTSAAIIILLVFLIIMNGLAVILRKKFERRW